MNATSHWPGLASLERSGDGEFAGPGRWVDLLVSRCKIGNLMGPVAGLYSGRRSQADNYCGFEEVWTAAKLQALLRERRAGFDGGRASRTSRLGRLGGMESWTKDGGDRDAPPLSSSVTMLQEESDGDSEEDPVELNPLLPSLLLLRTFHQANGRRGPVWTPGRKSLRKWLAPAAPCTRRPFPSFQKSPPVAPFLAARPETKPKSSWALNRARGVARSQRPVHLCSSSPPTPLASMARRLLATRVATTRPPTQPSFHLLPVCLHCTSHSLDTALALLPCINLFFPSPEKSPIRDDLDKLS